MRSYRAANKDRIAERGRAYYAERGRARKVRTILAEQPAVTVGLDRDPLAERLARGLR